MNENNFYTLKGYSLKENDKITSAMEDYLEMICRISMKNGYVRVSQLSEMLNVSPSSVSKMAKHMNQLGLVEFERYGVIRPGIEGIKLGEYLLYRHEILHRFFCKVNGSEDETEQTEKVEHFINENTVRNISKIINRL